MEKKKRIRGAAAAAAGVVCVAAIGAGIFFGTHVSINGQYYRKNAQEYDLTDKTITVQQYEDICRRFPDARILWTVPFQGTRYPMDTRKLTVTSFSAEDIPALDHLPELEEVDGTACADTEALAALQKHRPECTVLYRVTAGGGECTSDSERLTVENADIGQLRAALARLPRLKTLTFRGTQPEPEALAALAEEFPGIAMEYRVTILGKEYPGDTQRLDLSGTEVTAEQLHRALPLLRDLKELDLMDTGLSDAELKELAGSFPGVFLRCTMELAGKPFPTDSTKIDISNTPVTVREMEAVLPFFPKLKKLDMSGCGIDDEQMEALNLSRPDTAIIWTLQIGDVTVRTDDICFFPAAVNEVILPDNEELKKLRFCHDMIAIDIGHSTCRECDWLEAMPHMRYLILADTEVSDLSPLKDLKELLYLEVFRLDIQDYSPLLSCTSLQDLNIGFTYADPEPISKMTWLHNLKWNKGDQNPATRDRVLQLSEQLPTTNIWILNDELNIRGPWRYLPNYYVFREILGWDFYNQEDIITYWGPKDGNKILSCDRRPRFAGDVLAEIIRDRIDNGIPIYCVKDMDSEKAEILYRTMLNSRPAQWSEEE